MTLNILLRNALRFNCIGWHSLCKSHNQGTNIKLFLELCCSVMSWGQTEGVSGFYMFGEDSASAYVLHHQTSTVLEFWARDRRGFGGSDGEFEGQSMLISD